MRIVIDLQGAQAGSRHRGIGRYSLSFAQAIVRNRGQHEVILALSGFFLETIEPIRNAFRNMLPPENIRVWGAIGPVNGLSSGNTWRREAAEYIREAFLASLQPDLIIVSSLFEGLVDDAVTSIGKLPSRIPTATILYDLIPFLYRDIYLPDPEVEKWYLKKIKYLQRTDLLLAISESSRQEAISHLGIADNNVVNISSAADKNFQVKKLTNEEEHAVRIKYGLHTPFLMYTGGIDYRKNIEGLIRAYALVAKEIRARHQLAIVCSVSTESRQVFENLANGQGIEPGELVFTGYVPEEDLVQLYNLCQAFVFPSWHEGFGLPVLEAMHCGAAVIGANTSSIPEVIGNQEALFDPHSDADMADKITQVLTDDVFREQLIIYNKEQVQRFSWDLSAQRTMTAFEKYCNEQQKKIPNRDELTPLRPKLAFISPLPPEKSGIADYSAELLPELAKHYEIDVVVAQDFVADSWVQANHPIRSVEWFKMHANQYDRILYQFGNSTFHQHMFSLLEEYPGVIVLHDFYLSGIVAHMDATGYAAGFFAKELYYAHGYQAVCEHLQTTDTFTIVQKYPCNLSVLQNAIGIFVHSQYSCQLAEKWYGVGASRDWHTVPLLRASVQSIDRIAARKALGIKEADFVVCSFGWIDPVKLNHRLLEAFLGSTLANDSVCRLIFVGENSSGEYGLSLSATIEKSSARNRLEITGWVDMNAFRQYLAASDVAVQLRTLSRGETSAAVLDCMNYGIPTIVNANGSMAEIPSNVIWRLPDDFADAELIQALETLYQDLERRRELGDRARNYIREFHSPQKIAIQYHNIMENIYNKPQQANLVTALGKIKDMPANDNTITNLSCKIAQFLPASIAQRQLFVDVSAIRKVDGHNNNQQIMREQLLELIKNPPHGYKVEPVYLREKDGRWQYYYARNFVWALLGVSCDLYDTPALVYYGDIFYITDLFLPLAEVTKVAQEGLYSEWKARGVRIYFLVYDISPILRSEGFSHGVFTSQVEWLAAVASCAAGMICISKMVAAELQRYFINHNLYCDDLKITFIQADTGFNIFPAMSLPKNAEGVFSVLADQSSSVIMGTIDPTKDYKQEFSVFDNAVRKLWSEGIPQVLPVRKLLIDVSELVKVDAKTGIQRVVRAQLQEVIKKPPQGYRVEPVYLNYVGGTWEYYYVRNFALGLRGASGELTDEPVVVYCGDIFYAPDLFFSVTEATKAGLYAKWKARGVKIYFLVYDILPIRMPNYFPDGALAAFAGWVEAISSCADGLICISKAVAKELQEYLTQNNLYRTDLEISFVHLGADINNSVPTKGMPADSQQVLASLASRLNFLMVGTIEPRKGHEQTIRAIEQLWSKGFDVNLVIVGKQGWQVDDLIEKLQQHQEFAKHLFWLHNISDEYLQAIYNTSSCLIAASEGEGFGLPLIEAAQHGLPIIARDIPVFREVAGAQAFYFAGNEPNDLSEAILAWLQMYKKGEHPKSDAMPYLVWEQSVKQLLGKILHSQQDI